MKFFKKIRVLLPALLLCAFFAGCQTEEVAWPEIVDTGKSPTILRQPTVRREATRPTTRGISGTIIVDAGHGGKDPGAGETGYSNIPEKTIVLDVSKKLQSRLSNSGATVIMTRTTDVFIPLEERAWMAEKYRADLLVSVHADSSPDGYNNGATVYIAKNASNKSYEVAEAIVTSFRRAGLSAKGIRRGDFKVLVNHTRPSVLVECGYLTNREDAYNLSQDWYRTKVANAIADGIMESL